MGTYKFIKDYVSPNAKDTQAKQKDTKYRPTDQQTLQTIVDILFDGNVFGVCEFGQDSETSFTHQVKFYTIKELLEKGCVVSRLDKTSYAVSGFVDLDDSLIKEYQITRL